MKFHSADLSNADFTNAYIDLSLLDVAKNKPTKLDNIEPPEKSRWRGTTWESFHTLEWLEQSGYYFERNRTGKMLEEPEENSCTD